MLNNHFTIITGDTGSGKSTQLPQYLIDSPILANDIKKHQIEVEEYRLGKVKPIEGETSANSRYQVGHNPTQKDGCSLHGNEALL